MKRKKIIGWIEKPSPKQLRKGSGWFGELDRAYIDKESKYCVMTRNIDTRLGKVTHACMRNIESTDIPWAEKQRIKNELFGEEVLAIEVFPKESELVDQANMYHIWVLHEYKFDFGI